jgi:Putative lactococcus lactis phage r1t holin
MLFTWKFWSDALERAFKTAVQAVMLTWGVVDGVLDIGTVDWGTVGPVAAGGALLSILTSIISMPFGDKGTASIVSRPDA